MKKLILIGALALSVSLVNAQLAIGPTLGVGGAYFKHQDDMDTENDFHLHWNGGVQFLYAFSGPVALSTALKFSREGDSYRYVSSGNNIKAEVDAHYIRVPLLLHYYFGEASKSVRPTISIGPSFGFLVGGEQENYVNGPLAYTYETKDIMESFDLGANVALGLNFRFGQSAILTTGVNYYHGFKDVYKNIPIEVHNRNIRLDVGLLFPMGGRTTTTTTTPQ